MRARASRSREIHRPARDAFAIFFQAEDGIRALTVTGVQTCALPICWPFDGCPDPVTGQPSNGQRTHLDYDAVGNLLSITDPLGRVTGFAYDDLNRPTTTTDRSEERRVGKECRSRWSPSH